MSDGAHAEFPSGTDFLDLQVKASQMAAEATDPFLRESGEKLPATVENFGNVLSLMYRAACCAWGCGGGDHQLEWLAGRVINQSTASYALIRSASYDESLMLTRGVGEIANLLWLFQNDQPQLQIWRESDRKERLNGFGPAAVRKKLASLQKMGPPIDGARYQKLCEVGTHPVPSLPPSHYSATGRPLLTGIFQPVGVYVATTELAFAVAMCAVPISTLLLKDKQARQSLFDASLTLTRSLGAFTVLNYDEMLERVIKEKPDEIQVH